MRIEFPILKEYAKAAREVSGSLSLLCESILFLGTTATTLGGAHYRRRLSNLYRRVNHVDRA